MRENSHRRDGWFGLLAIDRKDKRTSVHPSLSLQSGAAHPIRMTIVFTGLLMMMMMLLLTILFSCKDNTMTNAIYDVKRQNEAQLMALPGVVSVGIGKDPEGQPAIIVGLAAAAPATVRQVPNEIKGYPVIIQTVGTLKAQ